MALDDPERESYDIGEAEFDEEYLDGEAAFDIEYDDAEASAAQRLRRRAAVERQRRIEQAIARRRQQRPVRRPPMAQTALAAARRVDLESKVENDVLRARLAAQDRRIARSEMATVAGVVANQVQYSFQDRFPMLKKPLARAGLAYAPLLMLAPRRRGSGVAGLLADPRVSGAALVFGIALAGERFGKPKLEIKLGAPTTVKSGKTSKIVAFATVDGKPDPSRTPTFEPSDKNVLNVAADGTLTAAGGITSETPSLITVKLDGIEKSVWINVAP
ncbi:MULTISPECIES: hypothetical protein [Streptomyces]|uniref:Uncharacterized protein n=1 Tax=Streptomyces melanosporofaciens TaxID=67327 RepID=A0A1H4X8L8_STRMJ|nr:hypothetical protein [Streptomyces melanosporofaciens]SED01949.1 hypothetical protein SAMN04490356_6525 [Streptomyces melanosporofaciens]